MNKEDSKWQSPMVLPTLLSLPTEEITWAAKPSVLGWDWAASLILCKWSTKTWGLDAAMARNTCMVAEAVAEGPRYSQSWGKQGSSNYNIV